MRNVFTLNNMCMCCRMLESQADHMAGCRARLSCTCLQ